jgi:dephospho-CoA kinase
VAKVASSGKTPRIGLTGGIASGKTLIAAMFEVCGAAVAFADQMARGLMEMPGEVKEQLSDLLGEEAYLPDGKLNRPHVGQLLFSDESILEKVNAIVHPAVAGAAEAWHVRMIEKVPYTIYESALLFETGTYKSFDAVILVHAPMTLRLERAMKRDNADKDAILARMEAQWNDEQRLRQEAFVILNDGTQSLVEQVWGFHRAVMAAQ